MDNIELLKYASKLNIIDVIIFNVEVSSHNRTGNFDEWKHAIEERNTYA